MSSASPEASFPFRSLLACVLALIGQGLVESTPGPAPLGHAAYLGALVLLGSAIRRGEWRLGPLPLPSDGHDPRHYRRLALILSVLLFLVSFLACSNNLFTPANLIVWISAVATLMRAFWLPRAAAPAIRPAFAPPIPGDARARWTLLLMAATALAGVFRFADLAGVPPEPISDHAEKILDIHALSQGATHIFFVRNTGREAFQMYWTLLVATVFGTGLSFLGLKLGTAILGMVTLPVVYLLGHEIGGRRAGLFAAVLTGIGYWPNVISRAGLRFPLYPLFVALTLLHLIRGLRTRNRNEFLLSGLFLGLGLHGYTPFRIVPLVVVAAFVLYWLHHQSRGARRDSVVWLLLLGATALWVFVPLARYAFDDPTAFGFRALSRLTGLERPLPGPAYHIVLSNLWTALRMFTVDNGEIWVHSVAHRPVLDVVSAALFVIGVVLVLARYVRHRDWLDLFLLVSLPLLLMPSILSLAFPGENPALNRAGGAYIPVFILAGLALDGLVTTIGLDRGRAVVSWGLAGLLLLMSAWQNFDLVFHRYRHAFRAHAWNSSDMGRVVKEFERAHGRTDSVWVVPFPNWVDTRLPAMWAGIADRDLAMWRNALPRTREVTGPKLFLVKASRDDPDRNDQKTLDALASLYPDGELRLFAADLPNHDFWTFFVPD